VSEWVSDALCGGEGIAFGNVAAGATRAWGAGSQNGGGDGCGRVWKLFKPVCV